MAQQFNDSQCRRADDPAHRCTDKFGDHWASPVREPRPGSMCWSETLTRDSYFDVDMRESKEVR